MKWTARITSQSLRKSGQFLLRVATSQGAKRVVGRNPFVNQVSFFRSQVSQSLRKSGRNPFVNQVSFFTIKKKEEYMVKYGRNPFVNQVSFFGGPLQGEPLRGGRRNPFVNQVSFFNMVVKDVKQAWGQVAIPS